MKRLIALLFLCIFLFTSCAEQASVADLLTEFVNAYGADGIIYSTEYAEGEQGYIDTYLSDRIFGDEASELTYAVFLNSHLDYTSECGAFLVAPSERNTAIEISERRVSLLDPSSTHSFIRIYPHAVFYSTMQNKERAERLADLIFGG